MANILQKVTTWNESNLALLQNYCPYIATANKKYNGFENNIPKNLGDSVAFDSPARVTSVNSLVAQFHAIEQPIHTLTINHPISSSVTVTNLEYIFNDMEKYLRNYAKPSMCEIGSQMEKTIGLLAKTHTYRFYDGVRTPITSSGQIAKALALHHETGNTKADVKGYVDAFSTVPSIVNSNLNQFVMERNEKQAMSWELGHMAGCDWYQSNLLATHFAGTEGQAQSVLTVVSVTKNADNAIVSITFSGTDAALDPNSIKAYDKFEFSDNVSGVKNVRYLTEYGTAVSSAPVQFRAEADAASDGSNQVTVSIYPPLKSSSGLNQNISTDIVAGMQALVLPDHRCGLITSGSPLYVAMAKLPEQRPFDTSSMTDPKTGAAIRMTYGSEFGQNKMGFIYDAAWGEELVDRYATMIALKL